MGLCMDLFNSLGLLTTDRMFEGYQSERRKGHVAQGTGCLRCDTIVCTDVLQNHICACIIQGGSALNLRGFTLWFVASKFI